MSEPRYPSRDAVIEIAAGGIPDAESDWVAIQAENFTGFSMSPTRLTNERNAGDGQRVTDIIPHETETGSFSVDDTDISGPILWFAGGSRIGIREHIEGKGTDKPVVTRTCLAGVTITANHAGAVAYTVALTTDREPT